MILAVNDLPPHRQKLVDTVGEICGHDALVGKIVAHALHKLNLLLGGQACNGRLENGADVDLVNGDEAVVVHVGEETHDELAIHAIGNTAVAGDGVTKVLDLKGALQAGGKEATKGGNEGGKGGEIESMDLNRSKGDGEVGLLREEEELGELPSLEEEDWVRITLKPSEDVGTKVIDRADEVLGSHHDVGKKHAKNNRHDPSSNETLDRLLWGKLDQLGATKSNAANVGKNIVGDDQSGRQEKPNHALKNVVHDEMSLHYNKVEGHVGPGKVGELELVVAGLQRSNKKDEAENIKNEADESVMSRKRQKDLVNENNVLKVVDYTLSIEKVHGSREPVPVETLGRSQGTSTARDVCNGDDFLERNDLDGGNDADDVDVAHEEGSEEEGEHDEGPKCACDKVGLFLFILGLLLVGG